MLEVHIVATVTRTPDGLPAQRCRAAVRQGHLRLCRRIGNNGWGPQLFHPLHEAGRGPFGQVRPRIQPGRQAGGQRGMGQHRVGVEHAVRIPGLPRVNWTICPMIKLMPVQARVPARGLGDGPDLHFGEEPVGRHDEATSPMAINRGGSRLTTGLRVLLGQRAGQDALLNHPSHVRFGVGERP
jgi:hypothetical protein